MSQRVIVLGGGVAGLSAAHELAERGFEVTVFETRSIAGGKARSMPVPGSGTDGRRDLPGEHGFRFFPGFYRHLPDTMRRIPFDGQARRRVRQPRRGQPGADRARRRRGDRLPRTLPDLAARPRSCLPLVLRLRRRRRASRSHEQAHFVDRLLLLLTSCEERRFAEYEHQSWWEFSGAERRSRGLREVPRRWAHAQPGRRQGARDERPHRRLHPAPAALRSLAPRRAGRPGPERADQRRLDRSLARAPARARRRLPRRAPGAGDPLRPAVGSRGVSVALGRAGASRTRPTSTSRRCPSRSCACWRRRAEAGRAAARRPAPPADPLDERDHVLPRSRRARWSTGTRSTSTRRGR